MGSVDAANASSLFVVKWCRVVDESVDELLDESPVVVCGVARVHPSCGQRSHGD